MNDVAPRSSGKPSYASSVHYGIEVSPSAKRVRVVYNGVTIADSSRALALQETRHPPVHYFPRADVEMSLLRRTDHHTHCPFKGNASYWTVAVGDASAENAAWSYEDPLPEVAALKDHIAFYSNQMDALQECEEELAIDASGVGRADDNAFVDWMVREAWEAATPEELVGRFGRRLVEGKVPLWRLQVVIRTLHPLLLGTAYRWRRDQGDVEVHSLAHGVVDSAAFQDSPLLPVFGGAGGIRRRLEGSDAELDFPILHELHGQGATDYVAMPLIFSDGQINVITLTSDRPGGFSTGDLGQIYELLPLLSRLFEVHAMRRTAKSLLETYLGAHTGERVLNGLIRRGDGEDIPAVIWICDMRDSTALAEALPRTDYLALVNAFFERAADAVEAQGGEVLKFIGDAVLAIFPIDSAVDGAIDGADEERARKACEQALAAAEDVRSRVDRLNEERGAQGQPPLRLALGLHRGDVTYGNVGSAGRLDFTVIGPAANEASRLSTLAKSLEETVLCSDAVARLVPGRLISRGRHPLRGVSRRPEVFALP